MADNPCIGEQVLPSEDALSWLTGKGRGKRETHGPDCSVSLPQILSALCFALDLTEDAIPGHALRTCLIGMHIAAEMRLSDADQTSLYYALLLKDVGCSSNSARMCQIIGGGDDRAVKAGVKLEDWSRPHKPRLSAIQLLWNHVTPDASAFSKGLQIMKIALTQHRNNEEMITLRCDRGASIVRKIGLGDEAALAVACLDEHWDGSGYALKLRGEAIPILARIMCAAQHLDVFASEHGPEVAISTLNDRSGRWFDPEIVRIANALHRANKLWIGCSSGGHALTLDAVTGIAPGRTGHLSPASVDTVCEAFADVVDAKSPFTFRHSMGVTTIAKDIARTMGFSEERMRTIYRGALLHDLGKLRVPNSILDKNGKLSGSEWGIVQEHPILTRQILERVEAFHELAQIAGAHHEKLDGSGYPDHLAAAEISLEARILVVADVFSALTEDRPYRIGMPARKALAIMVEDVPRKMDGECFDALTANVAAMEREEAVGAMRKTVQEMHFPSILPARSVVAATGLHAHSL